MKYHKKNGKGEFKGGASPTKDFTQKLPRNTELKN